MEQMKIYIVGCAKTGTTLLRRLFNAFDGLEVSQDEMYLYEFIDSKYNVAKRHKREMLSSAYEDEAVELQLTKADVNNIKIVYIERNRVDTLKSSNGYVEPERYDFVTAQAQRLSNRIDCFVSYEELIKDCNKVQKQIAEDLGLTIKYKFSDYPNFIKEDNLNHGQYRLRKIGEKK